MSFSLAVSGRGFMWFTRFAASFNRFLGFPVSFLRSDYSDTLLSSSFNVGSCHVSSNAIKICLRVSSRASFYSDRSMEQTEATLPFRIRVVLVDLQGNTVTRLKIRVIYIG